jgi:hypothetical protein
VHAVVCHGLESKQHFYVFMRLKMAKKEDAEQKQFRWFLYDDLQNKGDLIKIRNEDVANIHYESMRRGVLWVYKRK